MDQNKDTIYGKGKSYRNTFNILFEGIKKILESLTFEVSPTDTTNINEVKDKKEEKNDTGQ